tara:strand:+ start:3936 stop:4421 length:486 start_codon:yes stop_codon:yes gene_type:complete
MTGGQPPLVDPHTLLKGLIEDNTPALGDWTAVVNNGWLEPKKQKTYQIAIVQEYGEVATAHLDDGTDAVPKIVSQFFAVTLFHPTRVAVWTLYRALTTVLNDRSLTTNGVNGNTDYRWCRLARSDEAKAINSIDRVHGFDRQDGDCMGYRMDLTVELRWNE